MFIGRYKQIFRSRRVTLSRLVAMTLALSFVATLLPIASASSDKSSTMACCAGKTAGHCDSGIAAKKPQPPPEPMCGMETEVIEDDGITIVAEPLPAESQPSSQHSHSRIAETTSSRPSAESTALHQPCHMDCGACATSATRQQKRERGVVQPLADQSLPLATLSYYQDLSVILSSNSEWEQTSPRGPPPYLL